MIWKASKTYNDVEFCKEPKTIIVVDEWFNSLSMSFDYLWIFLGHHVRLMPKMERMGCEKGDGATFYN